MANRKVFISFLGTNNYLETRYELNGWTSAPVRFIQEALVAHLCADWTADDRIFVFCTGTSRALNWVDNGQERASSEIEKIGLEHRLSGLNIAPQVEDVIIPEGFSSEEVWKIFDVVYGKLNRGDEVYLDVTHAFRSIPLFSVSLMSYAKYMIGTTLKSVHYGAFEKLGPLPVARAIDVDKRIAPIVDMTDIVRLQQYTETANSLKIYGRVGSIGGLLEGSDPSRASQQINRVRKSVNDLDGCILTNNIAKIRQGQYMKDLVAAQKSVRRSQLPLPIKQLIEELILELEGFKPCDCNDNIEAAFYWAIRYDMYAQAATIAREYVLYRMSEIFSSVEFVGQSKKDFREFISSALTISDDDLEKGNLRGHLVHNKTTMDAVLSTSVAKELRGVYPRLAQMRNDINHGNDKGGIDGLKMNLISCFVKCVTIINRHS